jgi:hypothetical protein
MKKQHICRDVWHASCLAKPPLLSPMEYGWRTVNDSLHPVYFEGNMSAEGILSDWNCLFHVEIGVVLHKTRAQNKIFAEQ